MFCLSLHFGSHRKLDPPGGGAVLGSLTRGLLQSGQVTVAPCSPLPSCPALRPMVPGIDPQLRRRSLIRVCAASPRAPAGFDSECEP